MEIGRTCSAKLWQSYKCDGDRHAWEKLLALYTPLVTHAAKQMATKLPAYVEEADLASYGMFGLISAVERFEPERGFKFETFAMPRINGAIIDELRSLDWVPRSLRSKMRKIDQANAELQNSLQRPPTKEELAKLLDIPVAELCNTLNQISNSVTVTLDTPLQTSNHSDQYSVLSECIPDTRIEDPTTHLFRLELNEHLAKEIDLLPLREKLVISLYFYRNFTLKEIGSSLHVTESRASQLRSRGIKRLQQRLTAAAI